MSLAPFLNCFHCMHVTLIEFSWTRNGLAKCENLWNSLTRSFSFSYLEENNEVFTWWLLCQVNEEREMIISCNLSRASLLYFCARNCGLHWRYRYDKSFFFFFNPNFPHFFNSRSQGRILKRTFCHITSAVCKLEICNCT